MGCMNTIDLNLLEVFELLYEEGNVTKAAARLRLSQSAVSHALARLRVMLGDPLFVRISSGLQPTARAHELAPRLGIALAEVRSTIEMPVFDPTKAARHFAISGNGAHFRAVIARLIVLVRATAPGVSLQVINMGPHTTQALDQQQIDIALGGFDRIPARFRSEVLFRDEMVWIVGARSSAGLPLDYKSLLERPQLGIATSPVSDKLRPSLARDEIVHRSILGVDDRTFLPRTDKTKPEMVVSDGATATAVVAATDMIASLTRRHAENYARSAHIKIVERPKDKAETVDISMLWHSRSNENPGSIWLRGLIREAVATSAELWPNKLRATEISPKYSRQNSKKCRGADNKSEAEA
jgi:DNA-binding transcriptional LysR family regulator